MKILKEGEKEPKSVKFKITGSDGLTRMYFEDDQEYIDIKNDEKILNEFYLRLDKKQKRNKTIKRNTVTTNAGYTYNACEDSQNRMMRRILTVDDNVIFGWVLADNKTALINKVELQEALKLAYELQSDQWRL